MNKYFVVAAFLILMLSSLNVIAQNDIPKNAIKISDDIYSLGTSHDKDGRIVEGFMFIHKKGEAKPPKGGDAKPGSSTCYALLSKGAKWKRTENYLLNPINNDGMNESLVATTFQNSMETWDTETLYDVFGVRDFGVVDGIDSVSPDGKNEILFGSHSDPNTIAVTTVWGIYGGPIGGREIVEFDMLFNDAYQFGDAGPTNEISNSNLSLMDVQNIATHELGHALGLGHPSNSCTADTMYAYASFGETKKRTLNTGDKTGLKSLYG